MKHLRAVPPTTNTLLGTKSRVIVLRAPCPGIVVVPCVRTLKGNTVSAPACVLYPVILPVLSTIGVKPFKLLISEVKNKVKERKMRRKRLSKGRKKNRKNFVKSKYFTVNMLDDGRFTINIQDSSKFTVNITDSKDFTVNIIDPGDYWINEQNCRRKN